ncbi:MAG TPA: AI-2E family transporter [Pyrinomonadaceae bacterium]|nr:AI-2E family transporter [Pyrinomonadaceae bacterium]
MVSTKMNDQANKVRWIAVLAATAIALYLCWLMLKPFVGVLGWAAVLVIIFYPVHQNVVRKIKRRSLSALVSSSLVIVVFVTPLTLVAIAVASEVGSVAQSFSAYVGQVINPATPVLGRLSGWIHERFALDTQASETFLVEQLKNAGVFLLGQSFGFVGNILGGLVRSFLVVFTMYYLFRDGEQIVRSFPRFLPFSYEQSQKIIVRTTEVVSASVYGVVTIAMLQGLLGGIAFWILGIPSPILWAVVMAFVCMIPIAGSFFVWLPASIYLMLGGQWGKSILLILWGALVISTVDNFLRPRLIRNQTKLHELFIFFSVLGGISVFGLLGIVMGPVVLAITLGLLSTFKDVETEELTSNGT